jgi:hypothetical protein
VVVDTNRQSSMLIDIILTRVAHLDQGPLRAGYMDVDLGRESGSRERGHDRGSRDVDVDVDVDVDMDVDRGTWTWIGGRGSGNVDVDQGNVDVDQGNVDKDQGNVDVDQGNADVDQGNVDRPGYTPRLRGSRF